MPLPIYPLSLQASQQNEDSASLSVVHNLNMIELMNYINEVVAHIATLGGGGGGSSLTQAQFNQLLATSKNDVLLRAGMLNNETIDFNEYRLTRLGIPAGYPTTAVEFRITDTNIPRNTNFRKISIIVRDYNGNTVEPLIKATLTYISLIFMEAIDVSSTQLDPLTDPNSKRITIF